jgi:hypothetical protein
MSSQSATMQRAASNMLETSLILDLVEIALGWLVGKFLHRLS